ncbi:neural Wiskott-Aldrich syndrome protein-like [Onychostruthus taczanowskii]|uniref:neural Wiskott-Aldrich syndrome protein-like n=1 Tax=Onychostruthus taczanowskii TaxID=356909 RepID=UPI001B8054B6|nr:neural Wiskott-Aldrich syndrome protein-like [Onychostruthus taczanowskii]
MTGRAGPGSSAWLEASLPPKNERGGDAGGAPPPRAGEREPGGLDCTTCPPAGWGAAAHGPARASGGGGGAAGFGRRVNSASPPLPPARLGAPGEAPPPARAHTRTHTETRARCPVSIVKPPGTLRARRRPPKHGAASWEWPAPPELPAPRRPRREGLGLSGVKVRSEGRREVGGMLLNSQKTKEDASAL